MLKPIRLHYQVVYEETRINTLKRVVITADLEDGQEATLFDGRMDIGSSVGLPPMPTEEQAKEFARRLGIPCQVHLEIKS